MYNNDEGDRLMKALRYLMVTALVGMIVLLLAWSVVGYMSNSGVAEPVYSVEKQAPDYEVRFYAPHLRAEVSLEGGYRETLYGGFQRLADFIFGNNTASQKVDMTAPVISESSQKIAMTAPVLSETSEAGSRRIISFIMPREYSLETLPRPNNPEVTIRKIDEQRVAALRFGGYATEDRANRKIQRLKAALERDGVKLTGEAQVAQYNPPWTPPWMRRNEILIPVE